MTSNHHPATVEPNLTPSRSITAVFSSVSTLQSTIYLLLQRFQPPTPKAEQPHLNGCLSPTVKRIRPQVHLWQWVWLPSRLSSLATWPHQLDAETNKNGQPRLGPRALGNRSNTWRCSSYSVYTMSI
nr:hypothetical protein CFP56_78605 [Quercus suber]